MASEKTSEMHPGRILREGYRGKPVPPGAKPVKSAAADVPSKSDKNTPTKSSR